jgi:outer membrane protein TolC
MDAGEEIRIAGAARDAARLDLEGAILDALRDAATAEEEAGAADARRDAADAQRTAAADLLRAARAQLEVESGSFVESVLAAGEVVGAATQWREAAVEAARARVRAAEAAGWPPALESPCR